MKIDEEYSLRDVRKSFDELNQLIDLAEKTSERINKYSSRATRALLVILLISLIVVLLTFVYWKIEFYLNSDAIHAHMNIYILITSIFYLVISTFFFTSQYLKYAKEFRSEKHILFRLLDMTHELKEVLFSANEISLIEKAIVDMRLSKLEFTAREQKLILNVT